jgi:hypothetical protein
MATTPTRLTAHPLSPEQIPTRGGRARRNYGTDTARGRTDYFTLKAQSEREGHGEVKSDLGGSVRSTSSTSTAPLIVVGSSTESSFTPREQGSRLIIPDIGSEDCDGISVQVLSTHWHDYSDEAIQTAISRFSATDLPSGSSKHPYYMTLRILSSAVHKLYKVRTELEEARRALLKNDSERRNRAEQLVKDLHPSEQAIAQRIMNLIFSEDAIPKNEAHEQQALLVRKRSNIP